MQVPLLPAASALVFRALHSPHLRIRFSFKNLQQSGKSLTLYHGPLGK
jgi:hypothetical protein